MPLLRFYLPPGLLSTTEKTTLSENLTKIYASGGLPAFYVVVVFTELPPESIYVGGAQAPKFVRLVCEHLARTMDSPAAQKRYLDALDRVLTPLFESKGYGWEYHVIESSRELWKMGGIVPPPTRSDAEKAWVKQTGPSEWVGTDGVRREVGGRMKGSKL